MAGDESEVENLKLKVKDLETELSITKEELKASKEELERKVKDINKTQRKLDKSNSYNDDLCTQITTLSQEIQEFRDRRRDAKHVGIQAIAEEILTAIGEKPLPQWDNDTAPTVQESDEKTTSIAESLKQTAEAAIAQTGFVFDENTGLYYDYNSGYYYNCEHGLYYDPSSGTYFYFDETSGEYTFHSQVEPQYTCPVNEGSNKGVSSKKGDNSDRRRKRAKDRKEKESAGKEKKKKRKKEKEDKENSKSRKHKSRKKKHKSHKKGDNSESKNLNEVSDVKSSRHKHSKKKHKSHSKGEKSNSVAHKNRPKLEEDENSKPEATVEQIVVEDSSEDCEIVVHPAQESDPVELSEGEISSDSLATGESELESGELTSDSEPDSSTSEDEEDEEEEEEREEEEMAVDDFNMMETEQDDVSGSWPPCIRVMVTESDCLEEATLFIITCDGATIGREKDMNHHIRIPDINVSKHHADIKYNSEAGSYVVVDCASQNGTFLNDKCISQGKNERSMRALGHGDTLQMGSTRLLLHIHPGTDTCDDCEPGQVLSRIKDKQRKEVVIQSKEDRQKEQRKQLKQIKKRYGLENAAYIDNPAAIHNPAYQDKAATRRREVGSDNPHVVEEAPASVMRPISMENKGHKLLAKMGWKEGQGLGKHNAGIAEPINVMLRTNQSAGLGSSTAIKKTLDDVQSVKKSQRWLQAQQRYNKIGQSGVNLSQPTNVSFLFNKGPTVNLPPKVDLAPGESEGDDEEKS